jgi:bacteriorhodopsin
MNIQFSFTVNYIILLTTGIITFIEAIRTNAPMIRHIFNLETCISLVAGYFYSLFLAKLKEFETHRKKIDWKELSLIRYLDWCITTPMMLIVLCGALAYNIKKHVHIWTILAILCLNYVMLGVGYLGETDALDKVTAAGTSFVTFFLMYGIIYYKYIRPKFHLPNYILYGLYFVIWTLYGVVYFFNEETKNFLTNILDLIAKCFVGIGLWMYYTRIVV